MFLPQSRNAVSRDMLPPMLHYAVSCVTWYCMMPDKLVRLSSFAAKIVVLFSFSVASPSVGNSCELFVLAL